MRELSVSERFGTPTFQIFSWKHRVSAQLYCALLSTYSDHSTLPPNTLQGLLEGVRECAERHGGVVELDYQTGLIMAKAL